MNFSWWILLFQRGQRTDESLFGCLLLYLTAGVGRSSVLLPCGPLARSSKHYTSCLRLTMAATDVYWTKWPPRTPADTEFEGKQSITIALCSTYSLRYTSCTEQLLSWFPRIHPNRPNNPPTNWFSVSGVLLVRKVHMKISCSRFCNLAAFHPLCVVLVFPCNSLFLPCLLTWC